MTTPDARAGYEGGGTHTATAGAGTDARIDHGGGDAQRRGVDAGLPGGHVGTVTQLLRAAGDLSTSSSHDGNGHHASAAAAGSTPGGPPTPPEPANDLPPPRVNAPVLADPLLALAADVLDDLERVRIANENRLRQLTRVGLDADGLQRGFGLSTDHPDVARLSALVGALVRAEHDAELNLKRMVRAHRLGPWIQGTVGVGEKQGARLLAAIGDPYWNDLHGRPRTVSELWAYCGYHVLKVPAGHTTHDTHLCIAGGDSVSARQPGTAAPTTRAGGSNATTSHGGFDTQQVRAGGGQGGSDPGYTPGVTHAAAAGVAATRTRGSRVNWSPTAKKRAYLVAESCIKQRTSPYRAVYEDGRAKYADALHNTPCPRCGPSGHPAPPGSALSDGHRHARARRLVAKAVLRDLWREARRLHEQIDQ